MTVTHATGGDSWIRLDGLSDDPNGIDEYGNRLVPFCVGRTVLSGRDIASIALPTR
jgi:hypothetical protein